MRFRLAALLSIGVAAVTSACGGQTGVVKGGDIAQGKQLFTSKCGFCHTLEDAGTQGTQGPNLDGAFYADRQQHFKESTIKQVIYDQIYHAAAPMPRKLVTGADAASVAAYVASVAGTGPAREGAAPTVTGTTASGGGGGTGGGGSSAAGATLFQNLGCSGCHSLAGQRLTGPPLNGVFGSVVQLDNGKTVKADDAYLLQSIEDPDADIVKGFPKGIMSATIRPHAVPAAKAKALIAFIKSKK